MLLVCVRVLLVCVRVLLVCVRVLLVCVCLCVCLQLVCVPLVCVCVCVCVHACMRGPHFSFFTLLQPPCLAGGDTVMDKSYLLDAPKHSVPRVPKKRLSDPGTTASKSKR